MFVCHGNICRSPMAEFIFKKLIKEKGMEDGFSACSSATSTEEIYGGVGNPVYPPARRELLSHGIDPGDKRAVRLTAEDGDEYDMLIAMDSRNLRNMKNILKSNAYGKIYMLTDFSSPGRDINDPWYTGDFATTYRDILEGCKGLIDHLADKAKADQIRKA